MPNPNGGLFSAIVLATICAPNAAQATFVEPEPEEPELPECCMDGETIETADGASYTMLICGGSYTYKNYSICADGAMAQASTATIICDGGEYTLTYGSCDSSGEEPMPECPEGEYANGTECATCPAPGTSNEGSQSITDCCIRNYTGSDEKGSYYIGECCYSK